MDKEFEQGFMVVIGDLVRTYDMPSVAATIIRSNGLDEMDCSDIDESDKGPLRLLNEQEGLQLKGL